MAANATRATGSVRQQERSAIKVVGPSLADPYGRWSTQMASVGGRASADGRGSGGGAADARVNPSNRPPRARVLRFARTARR